MTAKKWAYEDLAAGAVIDLGSKTVTAEEIVEFASEFDPQPMHLDEESGKASLLGGLSASGWHTCAMFMRMMCDAFLLDSTSQGAPGIAYVRWKKPVLAGDVLSGRSTVMSARRSNSKPNLGFVTVRHEVFNQRGDSVLELENTGMFLAPAEGSGVVTLDEYFGIGVTTELGAHRFDADEIKRFAEKYDPQRFHVDEQEAKSSVFGSLCASGWHTAAMWMRYNLGRRIAGGGKWEGPGPEPEFGPSPGFQNLRWLKPVYAGETIRFTRTGVAHRAVASRPGWRLLTIRAEAFNSTEAKVLEFESAVLVKAG